MTPRRKKEYVTPFRYTDIDSTLFIDGFIIHSNSTVITDQLVAFEFGWEFICQPLYFRIHLFDYILQLITYLAHSLISSDAAFSILFLTSSSASLRSSIIFQIISFLKSIRAC